MTREKSEKRGREGDEGKEGKEGKEGRLGCLPPGRASRVRPLQVSPLRGATEGERRAVVMGVRADGGVVTTDQPSSGQNAAGFRRTDPRPSSRPRRHGGPTPGHPNDLIAAVDRPPSIVATRSLRWTDPRPS